MKSRNFISLSLLGICIVSLILYMFQLRIVAAIMLYIMVPLTAIYFYGIVLKNYKLSIDSSLRRIILVFSYIVWIMMVVLGLFSALAWHPFISSLVNIISACGAFILLVLLITDLVISRKKADYDINAYLLFFIPVLLISVRFIPVPKQDNSELLTKLTDKILENNRELTGVITKLSASQSDSITINPGEEDFLSLNRYISGLREELIMVTGGYDENSRLRGGTEKTAVEVMMIGPPESKAGKAYELHQRLKDYYSRFLPGRKYKSEMDEFVRINFEDLTLAEALFNLESIRYEVCVATLSQYTKKSSPSRSGEDSE